MCACSVNTAVAAGYLVSFTAKAASMHACSFNAAVSAGYLVSFTA